MIKPVAVGNKMFDVEKLQNLQVSNNNLTARSKVSQEFLAIFYKAILKETFKPSSLGLTEDDQNNFAATYSSDLMVDTLAMELAKSKAFSADQILPTGSKK